MVIKKGTDLRPRRGPLQVLTGAIFAFVYCPLSVTISLSNSSDVDRTDLILGLIFLAIFVWWALWLIMREEMPVFQQILALGLVFWWTISTITTKSASLGEFVFLFPLLLAVTFPLPRFRRR
jgi:hypothetical protein